MFKKTKKNWLYLHYNWLIKDANTFEKKNVLTYVDHNTKMLSIEIQARTKDFEIFSKKYLYEQKIHIKYKIDIRLKAKIRTRNERK